MLGEIQRMAQPELRRIRLAVRRLVRCGTLYLVAALLGLAGSASILAALLMMLVKRFGSEMGTATFGALLLVLALLIVLIARTIGRRHRMLPASADGTAVQCVGPGGALSGAQTRIGAPPRRTTPRPADDRLGLLALAMTAGLIVARGHGQTGK